MALPFNLKTTLTQPINFFTNGTQRAIIDGTTGFVGIGLTAPQNLLHLHTARYSYAQFTNAITGNGAANGLLVGISDGGASTAGHAKFIQQSNYPMDFYSNNIQRMQIYNGDNQTGGKAVCI